MASSASSFSQELADEEDSSLLLPPELAEADEFLDCLLLEDPVRSVLLAEVADPDDDDDAAEEELEDDAPEAGSTLGSADSSSSSSSDAADTRTGPGRNPGAFFFFGLGSSDSLALMCAAQEIRMMRPVQIGKKQPGFVPNWAFKCRSDILSREPPKQ